MSVWTQIDRAFSKPTTSADDAADYVPTQVIAELFKSEGYGGIAYRSAFGEDGYNIVLFDTDDANLTSCGLFEVKSLEFSFKEADNLYWVKEDGTKKSVSVEVVGLTQPADGSE